MKRRYASHHHWKRAKSVAELADMARHRLPAFAWEYVHGGAGEERTLAANRRAFHHWIWRPRTLVDISCVDTGTQLWGHPLAMPLIIGPTGYNGILWRDADIALARAARQAGTLFTLSTVSCNSLEEVTAAAPGNVWFQLYCLRDRGITTDLLQRARDAGVDTLLVTTDAVILGPREWYARCYGKAMTLTSRCKLDAALHPRWLGQALFPKGVPTLGTLSPYLPADKRSAAGAASFIDAQMMRELTWDYLGQLREQWPGKLIIKGILDVGDARRARDLGADGVVVTNHGGRQLDGTFASLDCLAAVVDVVGGDLRVLFDSGIRRGSDIAKAVALGADAALCGRATLYGVAVGGTDGASLALSMLREQLRTTLALLGRPGLDMLDRTCLYRAGANEAPGMTHDC